ncbi:MAG: hypothetical protein LQ340_005987 [Diploschistes diacapsis]|nr:MAG: hypothetical protein LQ340_005987 [Diploschistes diacapsis]
MAQGTIKKSRATTAPKRSSHPDAKKGKRVIKPKKEALVKKSKITKKYSAGLTAKTERNLAEKAGHLEMLKGGKKDKPKSAATGGKGK